MDFSSSKNLISVERLWARRSLTKQGIARSRGALQSKDFSSSPIPGRASRGKAAPDGTSQFPAGRNIARILNHKNFRHCPAGFDRVGGSAYVGRIINAVPNYQHAVYYAEIVKRKADLRRIIYAGVAWVKAAYEENQEPAVLVEEMRRRLEKIT